MAAYFTRAKARNEVELEDTQPSDSASVVATTPASISSVGLQVESTRELGSVSTEVAGPVTTHPQLVPEGDHPPVGWHGVVGSPDSLQVGVTLGYPSGRADPLDSDGARVTDVFITADTTAISTTGSSNPAISRQPPTVADTTAAAFQSPTLAMGLCLSVCVCVCLSVTSRSSTETAKRRITQITPHDSSGTLVF